jgi:DNA-binding NarL/FixJ family response regulator
MMQNSNTTSEPDIPITTDRYNPSYDIESAPQSIQVAICDFSATIRYGLQHILSDASGIDVVMKVPSQAEAIKHSDGLDIDVIIIDIDDEMEKGLEYIVNFREKMPETKILVFTACRENTKIVEAIEFGVEGFLCKLDAEVDEIESAICAVHRGGRPLAPRVTEALLNHMQSKQAIEKASLSAREKEVLDLISTGKTNNDIADYLYISVRTVKFHVSSIFSKLKVKNRTEAALWLL